MAGEAGMVLLIVLVLLPAIVSSWKILLGQSSRDKPTPLTIPDNFGDGSIENSVVPELLKGDVRNKNKRKQKSSFIFHTLEPVDDFKTPITEQFHIASEKRRLDEKVGIEPITTEKIRSNKLRFDGNDDNEITPLDLEDVAFRMSIKHEKPTPHKKPPLIEGKPYDEDIPIEFVIKCPKSVLKHGKPILEAVIFREPDTKERTVTFYLPGPATLPVFPQTTTECATERVKTTVSKSCGEEIGLIETSFNEQNAFHVSNDQKIMPLDQEDVGFRMSMKHEKPKPHKKPPLIEGKPYDEDIPIEFVIKCPKSVLKHGKPILEAVIFREPDTKERTVTFYLPGPATLPVFPQTTTECATERVKTTVSKSCGEEIGLIETSFNEQNAFHVSNDQKIMPLDQEDVGFRMSMKHEKPTPHKKPPLIEGKPYDEDIPIEFVIKCPKSVLKHGKPILEAVIFREPDTKERTVTFYLPGPATLPVFPQTTTECATERVKTTVSKSCGEEIGLIETSFNERNAFHVSNDQKIMPLDQEDAFRMSEKPPIFKGNPYNEDNSDDALEKDKRLKYVEKRNLLKDLRKLSEKNFYGLKNDVRSKTISRTTYAADNFDEKTYVKPTCYIKKGKIVCTLGRFQYVLNIGDMEMPDDVLQRFVALIYRRVQEGDKCFDISVVHPKTTPSPCVSFATTPPPFVPQTEDLNLMKQISIVCNPIPRKPQRPCDPATEKPLETIFQCQWKTG